MFGSHLSIAGSLVNALTDAARLKMDCVQIFTKNQQQWKARPLDPGMVEAWRAEVRRLGWDRGGPDGRGGNVSHASYLMNLASVNDELWEKSASMLREEIERCEALGVPYLVHHPGSFVGSDLAAGLSRIARAYGRVFRETAGYRTVACLEGTVGAGSTIGGRFEELADLRARIVEATGVPERVGFCLDTCHVHAAGYDLSTREVARAALEAFDRVCGMEHLRVWHLNDSKGAAGSRRDLHAHIGEGTIGGGSRRLGASGFAAVLAHPRSARVPKIMETPKGKDPTGRDWDAVNLARLRRLWASSSGRAGASRGRPRAVKA